MKEKALQYYRQGYNCSQCILKAVEFKYKIPISKQCLSLCSTVNTGFGIGGMCSVLVAGIMVLGLLFDDSNAKRLRMKLLSQFKENYRTFNCQDLIKGRNSDRACDQLVYEVAGLIESVIDEELY